MILLISHGGHTKQRMTAKKDTHTEVGVLFVSIGLICRDGKRSNVKKQLLSSRSLYRTYACASAAIDALVCVDFILTVFFCNAGYGTFVRTSTARDARVGNLICHWKNTSIIVITELYHTSQKIKCDFVFDA